MNIDPAKRDLIIELRKQGLSHLQIQQAVHIRLSTVSQVLHEEGIALHGRERRPQQISGSLANKFIRGEFSPCGKFDGRTGKPIKTVYIQGY